MRQNIVILGSTGSIGRSTLKVVSSHPERFNLVGLGIHSDVATLRKQILAFRPKYVAILDYNSASLLSRSFKDVKVLFGMEGIIKLATLSEVDTVVNAISGSAALLPLISSINAGKKIALANKEAIVIAGHIIKRALAANPAARIVPIDSEQNALFQCLLGYDRKMVRSLYLTASGGPFRDFDLKRLRKVTPQQALAHPCWKMGKKVTIDSATLMNKGLEVIEAKWLFGINPENIKVLIHRQAVVHSLVEFIDGSILGQLAVTDMRLPIQYALSFPERWPSNGNLRLDFFKLKNISFEKPDTARFPCLDLAYQAVSTNNMLPCVLNSANEEAVAAFLEHRISFTSIANVIERIMKRYQDLKDSYKLEDIIVLERQVRIDSQQLIESLGKGNSK